MEKTIPISEMARRSGVAASALRYYEAEGLITAERSSGGRRQYPRSMLRRIAFIRAAKTIGLSVEEIGRVLGQLPNQRTPTKADWARLSNAWLPLIEARIRALETLRGALTSCVGCGCLSLTECALYNPRDAAATLGPGARYLLGNSAGDLAEADGGAQDMGE